MQHVPRNPDETKMPKQARRLPWRAVLRLLVIGAVLFFFGRAIALRWEQVAAYPWRLRPWPLLGSFFVQLVAGVFWAAVWRRMAVQAGSPLPWAAGLRVYMLSNLAKYVPGSLWGYVGRAYLGREHGLTAARVGVSTVWEVGTAVVASLLLTAATVAYTHVALPAGTFQLLLVAGLVSLVLLLPPVARRWVGWVARLSRSPVEPLPWRELALYLPAALLTHLMVGSGFYLFASAVTDLPAQAWPACVGMWSFSATAGLLFILTPYGLGVKEGLLTVFLGAFMPPGAAAVVALGSRLWTVLGELIQAGAAALLLSHPRNTPYG